MANTGNKQAIIAYKVSPNGDPLDVDGVLIRVSGKRQAIALLTGHTNPNPALYEVELYFMIVRCFTQVDSICDLHLL